MRIPFLTLGAGLALAAVTGGDIALNALPPPSPKLPPRTTQVLFLDDFSDEALTLWEKERPEAWTVHRGMLRGQLPNEKQKYAFVYGGSEDWTDYALEFDVCQIRGVDKGAAVRVVGREGVGVDLRGPGYQDLLLHRGPMPMAKARVPNANGVWHHVRVEARGNLYRAYVDGELKLEKRDGRNRTPRGRIALAAYTGGVGECTLYYDNVLVTRLE